jgi:hypothetical protein
MLISEALLTERNRVERILADAEFRKLNITDGLTKYRSKAVAMCNKVSNIHNMLKEAEISDTGRIKEK